MEKVLVLCRGNVTRSPFIGGYLSYLYRSSNLHQKVRLEFDSSGIEGRLNHPVHPRILQRGLELGFDLTLYRSKHSDLKSLEEADLIFVVDTRQYVRFKKIYTHLLKKTFHIYEFGRDVDVETQDIEDPSELNTEEDFQMFFHFAESEVIRVWNFIENTYLRCEKEKIPFSLKIFYKTHLSPEETEKRYNFWTRRFHPLCPYCQSKRLKRIKRKGFIQRKILPKFNAFPYHCGNCNRDIILFVGAEIKSSQRRDKKLEKWREFLKSEIETRQKMQ